MTSIYRHLVIRASFERIGEVRMDDSAAIPMSVLKSKQHSELKSFDDQNRLITRLYSDHPGLANCTFQGKRVWFPDISPPAFN